MTQSASSFRYIGRLVVLFVAYLVTAKIGLSFYAVSGFATLIWPPTGLALAGLFFWGYEMWPAIAFGAFVVNVWTGASPPVAIGIATGNTLEALAGVYVLREIFKLNPLFERMQDSFGMIVTALTATLISATTGVVSLVLGGIVTAAAVPETWLAWWVGDSLAALVLAPFLIRWLWKPFFTRTLLQLAEGVGAFGLLVLADAAAFFGPFDQWHGLPLLFVFFPLLWISLRTGPRGITLANLINALFALSGTLSAHGVFAQGNITENLFISQIFVAITSIIFFVFTSTVEERKEAERALEAHVGNLEHAVEQISSEDQAKTDFLAILAHELRNPLSPIVSAIELIKINGVLPPNAASFDTIEAQIHTISRLLDDLLDVSRISHQKFKLKKTSVELQSIINHSVETVTPFVKDRKQTLTVSPPHTPIWLDGDSVRLIQIFVNILYNAAKYTNPGGKINIRCHLEPGSVRVEIADTGVGIEPHMFAKIFEPFVQASDSSSEVGTGLGIGLSLTKRLVELHGGAVSVASEGKGKGSTFNVTLPLPRSAPLPMSASPQDRLGWIKRKVHNPAGETYQMLIVDDNEAAANGLRKLLEHSGHTVQTAYNGSTALEQARVYRPAVIVLDIGLPDISGYEVAKRLRKELAPSLVLIALSGYGQKEDKNKAFAAGFNYHLTKPVSVRDIEEILQKNKQNT